jgi:hypothetical protein
MPEYGCLDAVDVVIDNAGTPVAPVRAARTLAGPRVPFS